MRVRWKFEYGTAVTAYYKGRETCPAIYAFIVEELVPAVQLLFPTD
jgi:hypothetical protein